MAKQVLKIEIQDDIHVAEAFQCIQQVIKKGRISQGRGIEKYCHLTVFSTKDAKVEVWAKDKRYVDSVDSFIVRKEQSLG